MVDGSGDDSTDGGRPEEGAVLSPHELDITESEHVEQIDEGRFVVSPEARTNQSGVDTQGGQPRRGRGERSRQPRPRNGPARSERDSRDRDDRTPKTTPSASRGSGRSGEPSQLTEEEVRRWLRRNYEQSNSKYAFDVTARFGDEVSQHRLASNDLVAVFESLMLWYAQQVNSSMPVEEVLGILLMESNIPVRYPPESVRTLVKSTDLGPDDTIADLLVAVHDEDGVQL